MLNSLFSRFSGAGGNVDTGLNFNLLATVRRCAAVGLWIPKEGCWFLTTSDGRIVAAVIRFTASPPEASGCSSTGRSTQTPGLPAVPAALQVTAADIIADPSVRQGVPAADGPVVSSIKTVAFSSLTAAQLLTADVPPTKRVFTWFPWRPL